MSPTTKKIVSISIRKLVAILLLAIVAAAATTYALVTLTVTVPVTVSSPTNLELWSAILFRNGISLGPECPVVPGKQSAVTCQAVALTVGDNMTVETNIVGPLFTPFGVSGTSSNTLVFSGFGSGGGRLSGSGFGQFNLTGTAGPSSGTATFTVSVTG